MKITKEELIKLDACEEGLNRFITQTNNTDEPVEVSSLVGGENNYGDLLWLAGEKLPKDRIVRFACDCALLNIEKIKPYTDKYEIIVKFLSNPTGAGVVAGVVRLATRAAIRAAAYADVAAADVAAAAADAADSAAHAAHTTYAAHTACAVLAAYAADAAADAGSRNKVDKLLKELFA